MSTLKSLLKNAKCVEDKKQSESPHVVPEHKIRVKIDMETYHKNIPCGYIYDEYLADGSWAKGIQWYERDITSEQLKDVINKCVNIKIVE